MNKQDAQKYLQRANEDMVWIRNNPLSNPSEVLHRLTTSISCVIGICYELLEDQYPDEVEDDPEPWLMRLIEERREVYERYDSLCDFRASERLMELDQEDRYDLKCQERSMKEYLYNMDRRLLRHLGREQFNQYVLGKN